jgi:tetratricopeptide (TPR) repeat protein
VVLVIEDLHWLDRASGDLLTALTRNISDFPLFLLITSRYKDDGSKPTLMLTEGTSVIAIDLQTLPKDELQMLGRTVLDGPLHTTLTDLLVNRTQGNPFFAEQVLYYYRDNHWLTRDPQTGAWTVREDLAVTVPGNVQAILIARVDRLPPAVRELVKKASVLGYEFDRKILQHITGTDIDREVRIGAREQLWLKANHTRYLFKHRLMRDAVYGMQLRTGLRDLHRRAGEAYEVLHAENLTPYYADLAYHYDQANLHAQAYTYTRLAAQQAMETYAYDQGLRYLDRALELTTEPLERFTLESWREDAYAVLGRRNEQAAQLATLRKLAPTLGPGAMAQVTLRQATYLEALSKYDQAITVASQALAHAEKIDDKRLEAEALALWGNALQQQGAYAEARERYLDGLARAQIAQAPGPRASNLKGLGLTAMGQSEYEAARDYYEAALAEYRELGDRWGESLCLKNLGIVAYSQGKFEPSTAHFKATLAICQEIGNRREQGNCLNNLGVVAGEQGIFAEAQTYHEAALTIFQEVGDQRGASIALLNLGVIMRYSGAFPEAERYYEAALHIRQEIGDQWGQSACLLNLGILAYDRETYPKAQAFFDEALIICREIGNREIEGSVLHNLGRLARRTKDWPTAESYFQQALALRRDLGQPQFVIEEKVELAGLYLARGHLGRARDTLAPALDYLNENPDLDGTEYPFRVLGICIQTLRITDADHAEALLDHAYRLLQTRAAQIAPAYRDDFWRAIPEHRQIATMWQATHQSTGDDDDGPGDG